MGNRSPHFFINCEVHMKYLKQKGTGEIYVWTETLAQRDDMELIDNTPVVQEAPAPAIEEQQQAPEQPQEAENTSQNSDSASAEPEPDPALNEAMQAFRRQVGKGSKKAAQDDQPTGDA
jgi:hypothetical protein